MTCWCMLACLHRLLSEASNLVAAGYQVQPVRGVGPGLHRWSLLLRLFSRLQPVNQ